MPGASGAPGPTGPIGPIGPIGPTGPTGPLGPQTVDLKFTAARGETVEVCFEPVGTTFSLFDGQSIYLRTPSPRWAPWRSSPGRTASACGCRTPATT